MTTNAPLAWDRIGLVLLGAGQSTRFGSDKLAAELFGEPLIRYTTRQFSSVPFAIRTVVTTPRSVTLSDLGFDEVVLTDPAPQSVSLKAAVDRMQSCCIDAVLIALADMPLISSEHLERLRGAFTARSPVCSVVGKVRCPPVLFPAGMLDQLASATGDQGARRLLVGATAIEADEDTLLDVDTPANLERAAEAIQRRNRVK
jgi:molybdenum cofactor cytidylyltransferase